MPKLTLLLRQKLSQLQNAEVKVILEAVRLCLLKQSIYGCCQCLLKQSNGCWQCLLKQSPECHAVHGADAKFVTASDTGAPQPPSQQTSLSVSQLEDMLSQNSEEAEDGHPPAASERRCGHVG